MIQITLDDRDQLLVSVNGDVTYARTVSDGDPLPDQLTAIEDVLAHVGERLAELLDVVVTGYDVAIVPCDG